MIVEEVKSSHSHFFEQSIQFISNSEIIDEEKNTRISSWKKKRRNFFSNIERHLSNDDDLSVQWAILFDIFNRFCLHLFEES